MPQRWWQYQLLVHTMPPGALLVHAVANTLHSSSPRSWHLSAGPPGEWRELNTKRCLEKSNGFIFAHWEKTGWNSCNAQVKKFREAARPGDKIYLFTRGLVTHVGVYTGGLYVTESRRSNCPYLVKMATLSPPPPPPPGYFGNYFIPVSEWLELPHPFKGKGTNATLYEAPEYPSRAAEAQDAALRNL
jgi:hypothetical protein